ncbi:MAG TPA: biotin--[acetyl-CoA-carboxylase] ligase [Kiritimatiellia bacterium]|nr:biotin--[acetyl-CoA-carboxylase] ligase [Kiritimatiellia bacterium]HRZ13010.1 biotin--[acetyl-CoA-carboxylase] ligase [Kiritimatiellia bacterium]HSA18380.1 biotin--[acetyl-CoA-carboxylase] ligase [Kiritimatiellia bacterium]
MAEHPPLVYTLREYDSVASTNDIAKTEAVQGAPEGLAILARRQERGRGRQGRVWLSPEGQGVYLSVLLRPAIPAYEANWLGVIGALAVAGALEQAGVGDLTLKWPNDVLARGRKIAGILVEPRIEAETVEFAVLGMGINVMQDRTEWREDLRDKVTSCRLEGVETEPRRLAGLVLESLGRVYAGFRAGRRQPLLREWSLRTGTSTLPVLE